MNKRDLFSVETLKQFEGFGLSKEEVWRLPKEELEALMNGRLTGLMELRIPISQTRPPLAPPTQEGNTPNEIVIKGRLGFEREADGRIVLKGYPQSDTIVTDGLKLKKEELKRVKKQGIIVTEVNVDGNKVRYIVQLDRQTNNLRYAKVDDIRQCQPTEIMGVKLTQEQTARLWEGKPVEVKAVDQRWIIGIDLQQPSGFKVVCGGMDLWHINVETTRQTTVDATVLADTPKHLEGHKCIDTLCQREELATAIRDEQEVCYSADGRRLLKAFNPMLQYVVHEGTEVICSGAFNYTCAEEIVLPESLKAIGYNAFGGTKLTDIRIPKNVCHIELVNPFATCTTIQKIAMESPFFVVEDGILYSADKRICYGAVTHDYAKTLVIPEGCVVIANGAFIDREVELVEIPDSVNQIGAGAFCRTGLKRVRLPHSIKRIAIECFEGCQLEEVVVPEGVERIGDGAFSQNPCLRELVLPGTLTSFGWDVLSGCDKLTKVTGPANLKLLSIKALKDAGLEDRDGQRLHSERTKTTIDGKEYVTMVLS